MSCAGWSSSPSRSSWPSATSPRPRTRQDGYSAGGFIRASALYQPLWPSQLTFAYPIAAGGRRIVGQDRRIVVQRIDTGVEGSRPRLIETGRRRNPADAVLTTPA